MNKIFVFTLTLVASLSSFAQPCNQYRDAADIRSCQELNAIINQAQQTYDADYDNAVARAQTKLEREAQKIAPSQPIAPIYQYQRPVPVIQTAPVIQQQPLQQQPVQTPPTQEQTQPKTRIHY